MGDADHQGHPNPFSKGNHNWREKKNMAWPVDMKCQIAGTSHGIQYRCTLNFCYDSFVAISVTTQSLGLSYLLTESCIDMHILFIHATSGILLSFFEKAAYFCCMQPNCFITILVTECCGLQTTLRGDVLLQQKTH